MKDNLRNSLFIIFKGFIIGSSMSVPGVSGGTMAILLGIYAKLISSISHFLSNVKDNSIYLIKFLTGASLGIGSLAFVIQWLLEKFPLYISVFFLGAVFGGLPALYKKTSESEIKITSLLYCFLGLIIVIALGLVPIGSFNIVSGSGLIHYVTLLLTGIIIALALILPGISTSHMLLILGMYDSMILAITKFDVVYIGILGISTLIGVFLVTRPIEWVMNRFTRQTYFIIIGFVFGSTAELFRDKILPAIQFDANLSWWISSLVISMFFFLIGFKAISSLARFSNE